MIFNKPIKEGNWVKIKSLGKIGIAERFTKEGYVFVRIPSPTNWPFPEWELVEVKELKRTRAPKPVKEQPEFEEALL